MRIGVPVALDLRGCPACELDTRIEIDLTQVAAHAGWQGPLDPAAIQAVCLGRRLPVQFLAGRADLGGAPHALLLRLPEAVCRQDVASVELRLAAADRIEKPAAPRVVLSQSREAVTISVDGGHFATYRYQTNDPDLPRPYFHPVTGSTGSPITQDGEIPGTKQAHFHHTGLYLAHQNFTDGNNWQIGPNFSRMRHLAFDVLESGPLLGTFVQRLDWPNVKGDRIVFRETRTVTVPARPASARFLDVDTNITCGDQPATWNATPYHLLAIRVPDAMLTGKGGAITNSEGEVNPKDGMPARWIDYSGPLNGLCGIALFNHPENLRHPTPFLNFQNQTIGPAPTHREPLAWQPGESRRFRFRVYFHSGDVRGGNVGREYEAYAAPVRALVGAPIRLA